MKKELILKNKENPEQQLIQLLKEKGAKNQEAKDLLISWTIEQEKQVEKSVNPEAPIQFNLQRARLYFKAGYIEEALENFEAAQIQAWSEQRNELYETITKEVNEIKNSLKNKK